MCDSCTCLTEMHVLEVVLATVLRNFKLSLSDSEIYWNMAGINYPTLDKTGDKHCMTLKVERVAA